MNFKDDPRPSSVAKYKKLVSFRVPTRVSLHTVLSGETGVYSSRTSLHNVQVIQGDFLCYFWIEGPGVLH